MLTQVELHYAILSQGLSPSRRHPLTIVRQWVNAQRAQMDWPLLSDRAFKESVISLHDMGHVTLVPANAGTTYSNETIQWNDKSYLYIQCTGYAEPL